MRAKQIPTQSLVRGYAENEGPDLTGDLIVTKAKSEGLHQGFFVRDSRGDNYLIKFDSAESLELATSAEVIASRFYYALGYNVPQYTVAVFSSEKIS